MKKKLAGLGVAVVALAGGVTYCGGEEFFEDEPPQQVDDVTNKYNAHDEEPEAVSASVALQLTRKGYPAPAYFAVRTGDTWKRPTLDGSSLSFDVASESAAYTVVTVCEGADAKGGNTFRTTVLEATPRELPNPTLLCAGAESTAKTQVNGAVRGVKGKSATVSVGTHTEVVPNPKQAEGVVFGMDLPAGKHTFVAHAGTGEDQLVAVARGFDTTAGGNVELDLANALQLGQTTVPLTTDGMTRAAGGTVNLWFDGTTRTGAGALSAWKEGEPGLGALSSGDAHDYLDIRAAFRGPALPDVEYPALAKARFITRADVSHRAVLPQLRWVGPSFASIAHDKIEFAWSSSNWAVIGQDGDKVALFAPVAYVGTARTVGASTHQVDVVVTPNRLKGKHAVYRVPKLGELDGWDGRWSFPNGQDVQASSGNLSAFAGDDVPDPGFAIAAHLDAGNDLGPATLGANDSITTVVAGSPVTVVTPDKSLADMVEARCFEQRPCAAKITENALAVQQCPDLPAYNDCRENPNDRMKADEGDFVRDLKHQVIKWYASGAKIPNALPLDEAIANIREENVKQVTDRTADEWWAYNPDVYQVYYHADPTRDPSETVWYGAYLAGELISIYPVNWDASFSK